jgi:hypothetical protein
MMSEVVENTDESSFGEAQDKSYRVGRPESNAYEK